MKKKFNKTSLFLILTLVFYTVGVCFIKSNSRGINVLTYNNIYFAAIPMCIVSLAMGMIFFGKENYQNAIIANGVLGLLLIWITSKGTVIATILYWLSLVSLHYVFKTDKKDNK